MKFDDLLFTHLGEFGKYQAIQFLLVCLPTMFTAMHSLSWTFAAPEINHRCRLSNEFDDGNYFINKNISQYIPYDNYCLSKNSTEKCFYKKCFYNNTSSCPNGYVYYLPNNLYTAINRWDIVCERSIWKATIQSFYYIGQMLGSIIFGILGDRIGRKKVFMIAIIMQIVAGLLMPIAPNWLFYAFLRIITGFAHPGIFVIAVIIGMELVGPSKRKISSVFTGGFFAIGQIILGILAYYIRDYRYLHISIALPTILFLSYQFFVPESPRWLVSKKRYSEADKILNKAAKMNNSSMPEKWWEEIESLNDSEVNKTKKKHLTYSDLFKTPKIRLRSIVAFFIWPVVSMVYYGVSMKPDFLGGDPYIAFIFGGFMELPAMVLVYFTIDKFGRKPLLGGGYFFCAIFMIVSLFLDDLELHWIFNLILYSLVKGSITIVYASIYTFTPELFPTVIRNTAMGLCSTFARIGAILSSYVSMWLVTEFGRLYMIIPFSLCAIIACILTICLLPETVGESLIETIEQLEKSDNNSRSMTESKEISEMEELTTTKKS
ncbi:Solute carrier family 22 member 13 [Strongyloides ratti]|uniref:Solute carrier family 22 member 13 n=1 Tax=Strongyloides ratti TaxID=34506 RepID=A0A090KTP8_STRRB|nr:Solute carrier family 22 member 13 [Strongyloides ratti]CEF60776.1 Solute carrier family 22 member 13 [Strongyloides ratti]